MKKKHELAKKREKAFKQELGSLRVANRTLSKQAADLADRLKQTESSKHALSEEKEALTQQIKEEKDRAESLKAHEQALEQNFTSQLSSLRHANSGMVEALRANATAKVTSMQQELADKEKAMDAKNAALQ